MNEHVPYSVVSLGCARNLNDSEKMIDDLNHGGFQLVAEGNNEQVTILNTCAFIQAAIDETEATIQSLLDRKRQGALKVLVVAGCYPSRFKGQVLKEKFPEVDLWVKTQEESQIQRLLSRLIFGRTFQPQERVAYTKLTPSHYSYIKISEGCNNWCSFCTIPKIRGPHQSKTVPQLQTEVQQQVEYGAKELLLIAEDTTCWGEDLYGKPSLQTLVKALSDCPVEWIRLMYLFPSRMTPELIKAIQESPNICAYLDMPIQHVNTELLASMRRAHDKDHLCRILDLLFESIPNLSLRSTFILGYPGETEEQVNELSDFLERYPFTNIGCFGYSEERETRSARLKDKVPESEIQARIQHVMGVQQSLLEERNVALIGEPLKMIYEGDGTGRSYRDAPDVDGKLRLASVPEHYKVGEFYQVQVTETSAYELTVQAL